MQCPSRWSIRLLRALVALWFVASGGELGGVHHCPMHGGVAASASPITTGTHEGHAQPHSAAAHAGTNHDGTHDAGHTCTCPGASCGSSSVASITVAPAELSIDVAPRETAALPSVDDVPAGRAVHVLPFAIGPPAAALIA